MDSLFKHLKAVWNNNDFITPKIEEKWEWIITNILSFIQIINLSKIMKG